MALADDAVVCSWDAVRHDTNDLLLEHCARQQSRAATISGDYERLWQAITSQFEAGGKRLRPYLCMLMYQAYGGKDYRGVLPVAASLELLHAAMLMHDDIIDRDLVRHNQPNVAGIFRKHYAAITDRAEEAEHLADAAAILAGDLLLSDAYQLVHASTADADKKAKLTALIGDATYSVIAGELLDSEAVLYPPERAASLQVIELKTSSYSFLTPMLAAAVLTDVPEDEQQRLQDFAKKLGLAFQLADDLLGVFGDSAQTGKSVIGDIREGKRSFLLQETFKRADEAQHTTLVSIVGNPDCDETMAQTVRTIMEQTGARAATESLMSDYAIAAKEAFTGLNIAEEYRAQLDALVQKAVWRAA